MVVTDLPITAAIATLHERMAAPFPDEELPAPAPKQPRGQAPLDSEAMQALDLANRLERAADYFFIEGL